MNTKFQKKMFHVLKNFLLFIVLCFNFCTTSICFAKDIDEDFIKNNKTIKLEGKSYEQKKRILIDVISKYTKETIDESNFDDDFYKYNIEWTQEIHPVYLKLINMGYLKTKSDNAKDPIIFLTKGGYKEHYTDIVNFVEAYKDFYPDDEKYIYIIFCYEDLIPQKCKNITREQIDKFKKEIIKLELLPFASIKKGKDSHYSEAYPYRTTAYKILSPIPYVISNIINVLCIILSIVLLFITPKP